MRFLIDISDYCIAVKNALKYPRSATQLHTSVCQNGSKKSFLMPAYIIMILFKPIITRSEKMCNSLQYFIFKLAVKRFGFHVLFIADFGVHTAHSFIKRLTFHRGMR